MDSIEQSQQVESQNTEIEELVAVGDILLQIDCIRNTYTIVKKTIDLSKAGCMRYHSVVPVFA